MDIETVLAPVRPSAFHRGLVILVGLAAVAAALLAVIEAEAGRAADGASLRATRLAIDIFAGTAGGAPRMSLSVNAQRQALVLSSQGEFRGVVGDDEFARRMAAADVLAGGRVTAQAGNFAAAPREPEVDGYTAQIAAADSAALQTVVETQNAAVDASDHSSSRAGRAVAGLTIVAMAAALVGLAAVLGDARTGRVVLGLAALTLMGAFSAAVSALFA